MRFRRSENLSAFALLAVALVVGIMVSDHEEAKVAVPMSKPVAVIAGPPVPVEGGHGVAVALAGSALLSSAGGNLGFTVANHGEVQQSYRLIVDGPLMGKLEPMIIAVPANSEMPVTFTVPALAPGTRAVQITVADQFNRPLALATYDIIVAG